MKKRDYKRQRKRVQGIIDQWITPLGLRWWKIDVCYYGKRKQFRKRGGKETVLRVVSDWRYRWAYIDVNLQMVASREDWELENDIVHELTHLFLGEIPIKGRHGYDHMERTCSSLTSAFIWVRDAGKEKA